MDDLGTAFMSSFHREVLSGIKLLLRNTGGIVTLIGKQDSEKEVLCQQLKIELEKDDYDVLYFNNPPKNPSQMIKHICNGINLDKKSNFNRVLATYLSKKRNKEKRLTLIFEQAEQIEQNVYRSIRMLNKQDGSRAQINIVLCGSPILNDVLALDSMSTFSQSIIQHFEILPTQEYFLEATIHKELQVATTSYWPKALAASFVLAVIGAAFFIPEELIGNNPDTFTVRPTDESEDVTVAMIESNVLEQGQIITFIAPETLDTDETPEAAEFQASVVDSDVVAEVVVTPEVTAPEIAVVERPLVPVTGRVTDTSTRLSDASGAESLQHQHLREDVLMWLNDWQNQNVEEYFTHYHPGFDSPGFRSNAYWRASRETRILNPDYIEISVELLEIIELQNNQALVNLWINFSTPDYADLTRKEMQFRLDGGRWQIYRETNAEVTQLF